MYTKLAAAFDPITPPAAINAFGSVEAGGPALFIQTIFRLAIIGAGIFALFNFILAGYAFISAGEDSKKIAGAWAKIYQSIIGLAVAAGAFVIAAIIGLILFGNANAILNPMIPTV